MPRKNHKMLTRMRELNIKSVEVRQECQRKVIIEQNRPKLLKELQAKEILTRNKAKNKDTNQENFNIFFSDPKEHQSELDPDSKFITPFKRHKTRPYRLQ